MSLSRRRFIEGGAAAWFAAGVLAACGSSSDSAGSDSAAGSVPAGGATEAGFDAFLRGRGYTAAAAAPLITGLAFNGGLRYDDDVRALSERTYLRQQVARTEDVAKKATPGTLPLFSIIGLDTSTPALANTATDLVLEYLTKVVALDPTRLRVTTTDRSSAFFPRLAQWGILAPQIRLRPWEVAVKDGSGSGYFAPAGHPDAPKVASYSVEYVMPDGSELEIAEVTHSDGTGRSSGGIGVERVEMARTGKTPQWADRLAELRRVVQDEAKRTGVALPPGLAAIAA